jgi:hypothetical protein
MRNMVLSGFVAGVMATAAFAEPLTGAAAKGMLFPADAAQVQIVSGSPVTKDEANLLAGVVAQQPYFGAVAISPDEKLLESKATIAVANFHSSEAAGAEALRQCDALRVAKTPCIVVIYIRPKGWDNRPLSLSSEATAGFGADYPAAKGALAVSASTGAWGIASGAGAGDAAVAACAKKSADKDCKVVIQD